VTAFSAKVMDTPWMIFRQTCHARAKGVQMEISNKLQEATDGVDKNRLVTTLEEMPVCD